LILYNTRMKIHAEKTPVNKSRAVAHCLSCQHKRIPPIFQFKDDRPEAIAQRKTHEMIYNSPRIKSQNSIAAPAQAMFNRSVRHVIQREDAVYDDKTNSITTKVHWDTGTLGGDKVGLRMKAENLTKKAIGKDANLKGSTPLASHQKTLMGLLPTNPKLSKPDKYIKGHLLNHNIGGPGKDFNMFPITGSANGEHLRAVEKDVKSWVLGGDKVDYEVTVSNIDSTNLMKKKKGGWVNASFDCIAKNLDTLDNISASIPSKFGVKSEEEEISVFSGLGNQGVFAALYDWAMDEDDPTSLMEEAATALNKKLGIDKDAVEEALVAVVLFDDTRDLSQDVIKKVDPSVNTLKRNDVDWGKYLGYQGVGKPFK